MRIVALLVVAAALLTLPACNQTPDTPPAQNSNQRPGVEVHAPGVEVKTNGSGTSVKAPGTDVHVEKKEP